MSQPTIFSYLDYRSFLKDNIEYKKNENKKFSYRYFSNKGGFSSTNFLSLVVKGKRNLTNESIAKIARAFTFKKQEREFFENLVYMNQASNHDEKNYYYQKMMSLKPFSKINKLNKASYEYFSKWYYPVVREIVMFGDRKYTPEQVAGLLNPKITPKQAEKALKLLLKLELIQKDSAGRWRKSDNIVSTGPEVKSLVIANFHKEMMKIAAESIERYPAGKRDISGLVLSINSKTIEEIKRKIDKFRNELAELELKDKNTNQIVYINIHAFPLTDEIIQEE